jgi:hypothetical protein
MEKTFSVGRVVSVYYDPDDPKVACLEPGGLGWEDCFMLVVGITGITVAASELRRAIRRLAPNKSLQQVAAPSGDRC